MNFVDTGPLVALIDRREAHHRWAVAAFASIEGPVLTCQAVITETFFLLRTHRPLLAALRNLISNGSILDAYDFARLAPVTMRLMEQYENVPMSFADACLVAMSASYASAKICTLDRDFQIYRQRGSQPLTLISPFFE